MLSLLRIIQLVVLYDCRSTVELIYGIFFSSTYLGFVNSLIKGVDLSVA